MTILRPLAAAAPCSIPRERVRQSGRPLRPDGAYVLYWMIAARRLSYSFALDRALEHAKALGLPLRIFEPLRVDYPHAARRLHAFVLQGMAEHRAALEGGPIGYLPYVEPSVGAGKGLLEALAKGAAVVVTDDVPGFFLPRMVEAAAAKLPVLLEAVDGDGLLPLASAPKAFDAALHFRRFLQRELPPHLQRFPRAEPLRGLTLPQAPPLPAPIARRWPAASDALLACEPSALAALPIDAAVPPAALHGGTRPARRLLRRFLMERLPRYAEARNEPSLEVTSGLSPWLHFGQLSAHECFHALAHHEGWTPAKLHPKATGLRAGFWGMSPGAEAAVDQLVTWRELGRNGARHVPRFDRYASLPAWAKQTLARHAIDPRVHAYDAPTLERAGTQDELWNAAQRQLLRDGVIHNYLRMLWGKNVLAWTRDPEEAFDRLVRLNDRWALDGRDPNGWASIGWVFGRYDRPWPERAVFGTVRCMTSGSTRRKLDVEPYLRRYGPESLPGFA